MPANSDKPEGGSTRVRRGAKKSLTMTDMEPAAPQASASPPGLGRFVGSASQADITTFLRQFIMLVESGTPILKSLKSLAERGSRPGLRALIADIAQHVESGNALWQAFERHPNQFDSVFVSLIKASEASGTLVQVLQRVVKYRERHELLAKRVRGGMLYPAILLIACFAVILFISKFVMPEFQDMFSKFSDEQLPALTRAFMTSTNFIGQWWWAGILIVLGIILAYDLWWVKSPGRRLAADRAKLKLPILGSILRKNALVEMTQTLSLLLRSGLPMMVTLDLVRNAIHNRAAAQVVQQMRDSVERGEGLEKSLRANEDIIPSVVTDMMVTGEESGRLDTICEQISETMEEEVNIALGTLGEALQPVLTVLIGVLVVLLMLAVFVPLVGMLDTLSTAGV